jgi:DNA-directed RNA polymerase specialized sigma24 family protein
MHSKLVHFAERYALNSGAQDAEDMVQEAYVDMVRSWPATVNQTWIFEVVKNQCLVNRQSLSRRKRSGILVPAESVHLSLPSHEGGVIAKAMIEAAAKKMPRNERVALTNMLQGNPLAAPAEKTARTRTRERLRRLWAA